MTSPFSIYILIGLTYPAYKVDLLLLILILDQAFVFPNPPVFLKNIILIYLQYREKIFQIKTFSFPKA